MVIVSDQVTIPAYPDPLALSMTGSRRISANLNGNIGERTLAEIQALEPAYIPPPGTTQKDLAAKLFALQNRSEATLSKQTLLDSRGRNAWNLLTQKWPTAITRKGKPLPLHLCKTHGFTSAECDAIDAELHALDTEEDAYKNTPDWAKADANIIANVKALMVAVNEMREEIASMKRPNQLVSKPMLVNGAAE
jgi:hypothetical protein